MLCGDAGFGLAGAFGLLVLGLLWFASSWRALLKTITAFTVAHSLTLAAASFGWNVLPAAPGETSVLVTATQDGETVFRSRLDGPCG